MRPSFDSRTATHRQLGTWAQTIMMTTRMGTLKNMPDDAPDRSPERKGDNDCEGAHVERTPHQHRLENAANANLYRSQADDQNDEWAQRLELHEGKYRWKCDADDGADVWYVIKYENKQRPGLCEVDAEQAQDDVARRSGQRAGDGLDPDVAPDALGYRG